MSKIPKGETKPAADTAESKKYYEDLREQASYFLGYMLSSDRNGLFESPKKIEELVAKSFEIAEVFMAFDETEARPDPYKAK
jgi:hypothetical protein